MENDIRESIRERLKLNEYFLNMSDINKIANAIPQFTKQLGIIFDNILEREYSTLPIGIKIDPLLNHTSIAYIYLQSESENLVLCIFFVDRFKNIRVSRETIRELKILQQIIDVNVFLVLSKQFMKRQALADDLKSNINCVDVKKISNEHLRREVITYQTSQSTKIFYLVDDLLKPGFPMGKISLNNKLNDLSGREWIKFTKTWFIHNPPPRKEDEMLHPAKYPESLIEPFIKFFTKKNQLVVDPFLGTGSTMLAAFNTKRSCIGVELMPKYAKIAEKRINRLLSRAKGTLDRFDPKFKEERMFKVFTADSLTIGTIWEENKLPEVDFCITSPPYWNQLKQHSLRQKERKELGLDTKYGEHERDIGNIDDYRQFIVEQKKIFDEIYQVLKHNGYLVVITNNIFFQGRVYPLAFDTGISLSDNWVLKDEKIWCQDDKALIALGVNSAWVGNRHHQYCLIFRKEKA
ncbi:MAG: DNA methyltransferase [Candidatus Helarchaeota archaeon]